MLAQKLKALKRQIVESQVWTSMFRHGYEDTPRNRALQIMANVWLHLHPPKIRRHAIRLRFTWCMGGITFLMFLVLTVTGVVLKSRGVLGTVSLEADEEAGELRVDRDRTMRNMHRW